MKAPRRRILGIIAVIIGLTSLALLWRPLRETQRFHVPTNGEAAAARGLFADSLQRGDGKDLASQAHQVGLVAARIDEPAGLSLADAADDCAGRGVYLLRDTAALPVAVVAPHRGADRFTGELARAIFSETPVAAAAWNSAPRNPREGCPGGDVTRSETHFVTAFSLAFAERYPGGRVVQLHGFEQERRKGSGAQLADAILSDGSDTPPDRLLDLADCLTRAFPEYRIAVYPIETDELGATTNRQGRALRAVGFAGFTHVEMAPGLREALIGDATRRARFAACLGTGL